MAVDAKKWFDVPDSKCKGEDGQEYFNVDCRFADHPILDVPASKIARYNVYYPGIVLHTRIKKNWLDRPAVANASSFVLRFDKGPDQTVTTMVPGPAPGTMVPHREGKAGMSKEDFDNAVNLIRRCWDAWGHYQAFRKSAVTELEEKAIEIIESMPLSSSARLIADRNGNLLQVDAIIEAAEEDPDAVMPAGAVMAAPRPRGRPKSTPADAA